MPLLDILKEGAIRYGMPSKKDAMKSETPLKYFLRPIMEEAMKKRIREMSQQMPEIGGQESPMIEPPSIDPLQNALMTMSQKGIGGGMKSPEGGAPIGS
jgi:hypothetical protein